MAERADEKEIDWLEKCNVLYDFLLGHKLPESFTRVKMPNLSPRKAFDVIYILQEALQLLPDTIEQCSNCNDLFDSNFSGIYGGDDDATDKKKKYHGKHFCDNCVPDDLWRK